MLVQLRGRVPTMTADVWNPRRPAVGICAPSGHGEDMGDRANIVITSKSTAKAVTLEDALKGAIVLYSHWGGYQIAHDLARALHAARGRWNDPSYGARIIVSQVIGDDWGREVGYGLSVGELDDNERPVLLVDFAQQKVRRFGRGDYVSTEEAYDADASAEWSFEDFAAMSEEDARAAHLG